MFRACRARVASAPGVFVLLSIITLTTAVLLAVDGAEQRHILWHQSSNLRNLAHLRFRVIVTSAFWLDGTAPIGQWLAWAVSFVVILAPAERWLGTKLWMLVFGAGHIGATVITEAGIWVAIQSGLASDRLARSIDVGVSYGFFAVAALFAARVPFPWRIPYLAALVGYVGFGMVAGPTFTDFGHAAAMLIGLALYPAVRARSAGRRLALSPARTFPNGARETDPLALPSPVHAS
jgi:hypothetical protein